MNSVGAIREQEEQTTEHTKKQQQEGRAGNEIAIKTAVVRSPGGRWASPA